MFPNLPNNIFNIVFTIGVFLIGYSYVTKDKFESENIQLSRTFNVLKDSAEVISQTMAAERNQLIGASVSVSNQFNVKNPLVYSDSTFKLTDAIVRDVKAVKLYNIIAQKFDTFRNNQSKKITFINNTDEKLKLINEDINRNFGKIELCVNYIVPCAIVFITIGALGMSSNQILQNRLIFQQIREAEKIINCQSCGKLFNGTVQRGKFSDSSPNEYYCSLCFDIDGFTESDLTVESLSQRIFLQNSVFKKVDKNAIYKSLKKLRRWNDSIYE